MRDPLRLKVKKPRKKRERHHIYYNKDNEFDNKMVYITRKISRGDLDLEKTNDRILVGFAKRLGIIDKDYNILKEEYLLCQTKRAKYLESKNKE